MNKLTRIGLNAMVAFTMMFAATAVVAQEKVVASANVEVKESVNAMVLAKTMEDMKSEFAKAKSSEPKNAVSKPTIIGTKRIQDLHWYRKLGPDDYEYVGTGTNPPGVDCPEIGGELCAVGFLEEHPENSVTDEMANSSPDKRRYEIQ